MAEEDSSVCGHEPWPESTQKCNPQDCESSEPGGQQAKPAWEMMGEAGGSWSERSLQDCVRPTWLIDN